MSNLRNFLFIFWWLSLVATGIQLGIWQLDRLEWKNRWLHNIERAYATEPPRPFVQAEVFPKAHDETTFYRGRITGYMYDMTSMLVGPRTYKGQVGWRWYSLLRLSDDESVWADRGFVPENFVPETINNAQVFVTGTLRQPSFSGAAKKIIQKPDGKGGMVAAWLDAEIFNADTLKASGRVSPLILYVETPTTTDKSLILIQDRPVLRNQHLAYALFWFTMSAVALVYLVLAFRARFKSTNQKIG